MTNNPRQKRADLQMKIALRAFDLTGKFYHHYFIQIIANRCMFSVRIPFDLSTRRGVNHKIKDNV